MNAAVQPDIQTLDQIVCYRADCGISWWMPRHWQDARRDDCRRFYCPNGHVQCYGGPSEAERERKRRQAAEQDAAWQKQCLDAEIRRHRATKGQVTRIKRRVAAGACPCCQRSFAHLRQHMANKHADYVEEA